MQAYQFYARNKTTGELGAIGGANADTVEGALYYMLGIDPDESDLVFMVVTNSDEAAGTATMAVRRFSFTVNVSL